MQATKGRVVNLGAGALRACGREAAMSRRVWNHFLALNIERYAREAKFIFYHEMAKLLTQLRADPELRFGEGGVAAQQQVLRALDRALRDAFKSSAARKGFPRFKAARHHRDAVRVPGANARLLRSGDGEVTHVGLPRLPLLRVRGLRLPPGARVATVTLREDGHGWQVGIGFEAPLAAAQPAAEPSVGIDMGLTDFCVLSTGEKVANPRHARKAATRLRRAQRALSRKRKGSVNRRRAVRRVARLHQRVARIREDFHHQTSRRLVDRFDRIAVEDLAAKALMRTRMAASVADAGWGEFLRQLAYKAEWAGRAFARYPRFARSSGVCPDCGTVGERLALAVRSWTCPDCGAVHDRDVAAARIIELAHGAQVGAVSPEPRRPPAARKRGSAGQGKAGGSAARRPAGSPANIPEMPRLGASKG